MRLHRPQTTAAALGVLDEGGDECKIIAGGTALMIMMRSGLVFPEQLVAIDRLPDLHHVVVDDASIRLGALATLQAMERSAELQHTLPTLTRALGLVANHRVRNRATIGGNLSESDYASDPPAILRTLGCRLRVSSTRADRWVELSDFLVDYYENALEPNEMVTEVEVKRPAPTARTTYIKYVSRSAEDRPCVGVAAYLDRDASGRCTDVRVAVAGATATPFVLAEVTQACIGGVGDDNAWRQVASAYAAAIEPIDDLRGSATYRKHVTGELVRRALETVAAPGDNTASRL